MKKFGIYCSGNASRVLNFYNKQDNIRFYPDFIIYDGENEESFQALKSVFKETFFHLNHKNLNESELLTINQTTSDFILRSLQMCGTEYLICFGNKILKKNLVRIYENKLINLHPSLLPAFPGLKAIDKALHKKVTFLGNTAHFINETIDEGDIIAQSIMLREEFEDYEDVLELQFPLLKLVFRDFLNFNVSDIEISSDIIHRSKKYLIPSKCNH